MKDECDHECVQKLRYVRDYTTPGVHISEMGEIWEVECRDCHERFEQFFSNR